MLPQLIIDWIEVFLVTLVLWILGDPNGQLVVHANGAREHHLVSQVLKYKPEKCGLSANCLSSNVF